MKPSLTPCIVAIFLGLFLATQPVAAQDGKAARAEFTAAKSYFKRNIRSDKLADRRHAIQRMRRIKDPRAVTMLMAQLHRAGKEADKYEKKAKPHLDKLAKYRAKYDKRVADYVKNNPKAQGIPAGLVGQLVKNIESASARVAPLDKLQRLERSTIIMLKTAIGDVITGLEEEAQVNATNLILSEYEKLRKPKKRALYLDILGYVNNSSSVIGLVGIAANASDASDRVAAIKSLQRLGDPRGGKAIRYALEDEQWQVRATAIEAAQVLASVDMIPALIARLKIEDGRLRGDITRALSLLSGTSYAINAALWEKWWKKNEKELRAIVKNINSKDPTEQSVGRQAMVDQGFLIAARLILEKRGITLPLIQAHERRRLVDPQLSTPAPVTLEKEEEEDLAAAGETMRSRDKPVRELAFEHLVSDPFFSSQDPGRRSRLIRLMGHVGGKKAIGILSSLMRPVDAYAKKDFERRMDRREKDGRMRGSWYYDKNERLLAARALGHCATDNNQVMAQLRAVFQEDERSVELMLAAVEAYETIGTATAVKALIKAFGELVSLPQDERSQVKSVEAAIVKSLQKITKQTIGDSHDAWVAWWSKAQNDFKTDKDKKKEELVASGRSEEGGTRFYGIKTYSKRVVFVLDISGSMNEPAEYQRGKTKIEVARTELIRAIASLPKDAKFNLIFYSTDYRVWKKKLVVADAKTKRAAKEYVAEVKALGGTNIYDPLVHVFDVAGRGTHDKGYEKVALDTIFFLSDGQPTAGRVTSTEDILNKVLSLNSLRKIKIHTIGIGKGHARGFMKALAERSGGTYVSR